MNIKTSKKEIENMAQYKVVAGPKRITIDHDGNMEDAMGKFQSIIQQEEQGGWELVCISPIEITQEAEPLPPPGCIAKLLYMFGVMSPPVQPPPTRYSVNMLVFVKKN
jgi:hypothetical protein